MFAKQMFAQLSTGFHEGDQEPTKNQLCSPNFFFRFDEQNPNYVREAKVRPIKNGHYDGDFIRQMHGDKECLVTGATS